MHTLASTHGHKQTTASVANCQKYHGQQGAWARAKSWSTLHTVYAFIWPQLHHASVSAPFASEGTVLFDSIGFCSNIIEYCSTFITWLDQVQVSQVELLVHTQVKLWHFKDMHTMNNSQTIKCAGDENFDGAYKCKPYKRIIPLQKQKAKLSVILWWWNSILCTNVLSAKVLRRLDRSGEVNQAFPLNWMSSIILSRQIRLWIR